MSSAANNGLSRGAGPLTDQWYTLCDSVEKELSISLEESLKRTKNIQAVIKIVLDAMEQPSFDSTARSRLRTLVTQIREMETKIAEIAAKKELFSIPEAPGAPEAPTAPGAPQAPGFGPPTAPTAPVIAPPKSEPKKASKTAPKPAKDVPKINATPASDPTLVIQWPEGFHDNPNPKVVKYHKATYQITDQFIKEKDPFKLLTGYGDLEKNLKNEMGKTVSAFRKAAADPQEQLILLANFHERIESLKAKVKELHSLVPKSKEQEQYKARKIAILQNQIAASSAEYQALSQVSEPTSAPKFNQTLAWTTQALQPGKRINTIDFIALTSFIAKTAHDGVEELTRAIQGESDPTNRLKMVAALNSCLQKLSRLDDVAKHIANPKTGKVAEIWWADELSKKLTSVLQKGAEVFAALHSHLNVPHQQMAVKSTKGVGGGMNPSFHVVDANDRRLGIFKLASQEAPGGEFQSACFRDKGRQAMREAACCMINESAGHLTTLPLTFIQSIQNNAFTAFEDASEAQVGSCQIMELEARDLDKRAPLQDEYDQSLLLQSNLTVEEVNNPRFLQSADLFYSQPKGKDEIHAYTPAQAKAIVNAANDAYKAVCNKFTMPDAQGLMAFHLLVGALDETNVSNTMCKMMPTYDYETKSIQLRPVPVAIDKGLSLPDLTKPDWCPGFLWTKWPQAKEPFCYEVSQKIRSLDVEKMIAELKKNCNETKGSGGGEIHLDLEDNSYLFLRLSSAALKKAVELEIPPVKLAAFMRDFFKSELKTILISAEFKALKDAEKNQFLTEKITQFISNRWEKMQSLHSG